MARDLGRCSVEGCEAKHEARGFCAKHYQRWRAHGDPAMTKLFRATSFAEALERFVLSKPRNGCWIWTGNSNKLGYGIASISGRRVLAHRASYETHKGPIPPEGQINHTCDNPSCVNPDHLYVGTQKENIADMIRRNRIDRKGENCNGPRKLCGTDVEAIRANTDSEQALAVRFGVSKRTILDVKTRRSWSHLS